MEEKPRGTFELSYLSSLCTGASVSCKNLGWNRILLPDINDYNASYDFPYFSLLGQFAYNDWLKMMLFLHCRLLGQVVI